MEPNPYPVQADQALKETPVRVRTPMRTFFLALSLAACATLAVLLYQALERERGLEAQLSDTELEFGETKDMLDDCWSRLTKCQREEQWLTDRADRLSAQLSDTELEFGETKELLDDCRSRLTKCQREEQSLTDRADRLSQMLTTSQSKLDDIASAIRRGSIGLTDIPSASWSIEFGDECEQIMRKHNDLVGRFNAALERSDQLGDTINEVTRAIRR